MNSHEAANKFVDHVGINRNSYLNSDAAKMIDNEADDVIQSGKLRYQKNQYSKAVEIALERMIEWYDTGLEFHFDNYHNFLASHRRACVWTIFLRKHHSRGHRANDDVNRYNKKEIKAMETKKKFRLLDGNGSSVIGDVTEDNAYLVAYPNYMNGVSHKDLKVGQSCNARYSLSGESATYRILRVE